MSKAEYCNLCGASENSILYPHGVAQIHQIVECSKCGLMYANPMGDVDVEQIIEYDPNYILERLDTPRIQQRIKKERMQVRDYRETRDFVNKEFQSYGSLLEIGSGYGYLCDFFRTSGWDVTGLNPTRPSPSMPKRYFN